MKPSGHVSVLGMNGRQMAPALAALWHGPKLPKPQPVQSPGFWVAHVRSCSRVTGSGLESAVVVPVVVVVVCDVVCVVVVGVVVVLVAVVVSVVVVAVVVVVQYGVSRE